MIFLHTALFICFMSQIINANDISGCGGFIKSPVSIAMDKIYVKLYTSDGALKEWSDCAPTNGYYFIPLSDNGSYTLKVEPPSGWHFQPKQFKFTFDGSTDVCSRAQDINFNFEGFTATGKVATRGSDSGPEGVKITLRSEKNSSFVLSTTTGKGGIFQFAPLLPGRYEIKADDSSLRLMQKKSIVTVVNDNVNVESGLLVAGYDVSGQVTANGEPMKGVTIFLYSLGDKSSGQPLDCDKGTSSESGYLCQVVSDSNGRFKFGGVALGRYRLKPYYETFDVLPKTMEFTVNMANLNLPQSFQVKGFSVRGSVKASERGSGLAGAKVVLNGKVVAITDDQGLFGLDKMDPGTYKLSAITDDYKFSLKEVRVSPTSPELPPLVAEAVKACGQVVPHVGKAEVVVTRSGISPFVVAADPSTGDFCTFLKPGVYTFSVRLPDNLSGVSQYFPASQDVEVKDRPVRDIIFAQLRAKLVGRAVRLAPIPGDTSPVVIKLKSEGKVLQVAQLPVNQDGFIFTDVAPGVYDVEMKENSLCWETTIRRVGIKVAEAEMPDFVQTGYSIRVRSTHSTVLHVRTHKNEKVKKIDLKSGETSFCVEKLGEYILVPESCHGFQKDKYHVIVGKPEPVELKVVAHDISGVVSTLVNVPVHLDISLNGVFHKRLGPLQGVKQSDGSFTYAWTQRIPDSQAVQLVPVAPTMLFTPESAELSVPGDCLPHAAQFQGERGQMIEGKIIPPLAGVKVTVKSTAPSVEHSATTSGDGQFSFGPYRLSSSVTITAEKESYVLSGPDVHNNFIAHKLAEVQVLVTDTDGGKLPGVLLSLTGGENYRKNSMTENNGERIFHSLSPGEYFLRAMMKEYKFEPASLIIQLQAGKTQSIKLIGRRVAYSVLGSVRSLNGEAEGGVSLTVTGLDSCSAHQEEAVSETSGDFRIRGLLPHCEYTLQMRQTPSSNVYRIAPAQTMLKTIEGDVDGIRLIGFHRAESTELSARISAAIPDHLKTITLKLSKEESPESPIHVIRLDTVAGGAKAWEERFIKPGLLVQLPYVPRDGTPYLITAESTLSRSSHVYSEPVVRFTADATYVVLSLQFNATVRPVEQENPRHLVAGLLVLLLTLIVWQARDGFPAVVALASLWTSRQDTVQSKPEKSEKTDKQDRQEVAAAAQAIESIKKKSKPRKA